ncbi:MAG: SHOCT domain-containing protein [Dehalococcoidia bacterium]|nr:SHOCT domain-containing protein [Dehalococcoidia bacterium]
MCFRYHVPSFWPLSWSALFLSLGWNFLEYGLDPPGNGTSADAWGWLLCAVIFGLMGGVPLFLGGKLLWSSILPFGPRPAPRPRTSVPNFRIVRRGHVADAEPEPVPDTDDHDTGIVGALERLAALRAAGALTDSEFAAAKQRLLGDDA